MSTRPPCDAAPASRSRCAGCVTTGQRQGDGKGSGDTFEACVAYRPPQNRRVHGIHRRTALHLAVAAAIDPALIPS